MAGRRLAVLVANDEYDDAGLTRLQSPAQDAEALAALLGDPGVGGFEVQVLRNQPVQAVRTAVEELFVDRSPDDLVFLHFSCHGVKNAEGELFLAMRDTRPTRLASTGVAAGFVSGQMASSRAQRIALFLDCCYGGAFPRGMVVRSGSEALVGEAFTQPQDLGEGRGRVVVTSSSAMQYAFEGGELASQEVAPSVFTTAVVNALTTGEADRDGDGWVGMGELFGYVSDEVRKVAPQQTPQMWTFGQQGDLLLARSRMRRVRPTPLSDEILHGMRSESAPLRFGMADLLRERLSSADLGLALAAWQALGTMRLDDSRKVGDLVDDALADAALRLSPASLPLLPGQSGRVAFAGPPLARAVSARSPVPWLQVEYDESGLTVSATPEAREQETVVEVVGPTGTTALVVRTASALPDEPILNPPPVAVETDHPATPRRSGRWPLVGWAGVAVLGLVLVGLNDPGNEGSRMAWYDPTTGNGEARDSTDAYLMASLLVMVAGAVGVFVRRWRAALAGAALGACGFLALSALSVYVQGDLPVERGWVWPWALIVALGVMVVLWFWCRPVLAPAWTWPRLPLVLLGLAVVAGWVAIGLRNDSYANYRGGSTMLYPVLFGVLGLVAITRAGDRDTRLLLGLAAITAAVLEWLLAVPGVRLLNEGSISSDLSGAVWTHLLVDLVAVGLLLVGLLVANRRKRYEVDEKPL